MQLCRFRDARPRGVRGGRAVWGRKLNVGQTRLGRGIDQTLAPES